MKFSIVICNYNYADYLNEAINSAVNQTYSNIEVIVIDDGSTDQSKVVLNSWVDKVIVIYKENEGQVSAYNAGFNEANGDIVIFLDSDDVLDFDACEKIVENFQDNNIVKVHYKLRLIDRESNVLGPSIPTFLSYGNVKEPLVKKGLFYLSSPGSGNAYRKSALNNLFPLPIYEDDKHGADFYCIFGVIFFGEIKAINSILASYRVHSEPNHKENLNSLVFGNAAKSSDELARHRERLVKFKKWIVKVSGGRVNLVNFKIDFSMLKQEYCTNIFNKNNYYAGFLAGFKFLPNLVESILSRLQFPFYKKIALLIWALLVLLLPRKIGYLLATKISNPTTR